MQEELGCYLVEATILSGEEESIYWSTKVRAQVVCSERTRSHTFDHRVTDCPCAGADPQVQVSSTLEPRGSSTRKCCGLLLNAGCNEVQWLRGDTQVPVGQGGKKQPGAGPPSSKVEHKGASGTEQVHAGQQKAVGQTSQEEAVGHSGSKRKREQDA